MKNLLIIALIATFFCCGCSSRYYAPAIYNDDISYQPKPGSFDSVKSKTYVSLGEAFHDGVDDNNSTNFFELNISRGHVFKNTNLSYGAFGFAGSIDNINHKNELTDPNSFDTKSFAGIGGRASFNMYKVIDRVNFRYIGVEAAYSKEFGDYAAYRRLVQNVPDYYATTRTEMVTAGLTSEVLWHNMRSTDNQNSLRLFVGKSIGNYSYLNPGSDDLLLGAKNAFPFYMTVSYFKQINHFFGVAEVLRTEHLAPGLRIKFGYGF